MPQSILPVLLLLAAAVDTGEAGHDPPEPPLIVSIDVDSGGKAKPRSVLRQFALREGDEFDPELWQADVQSMLNLGMVKRASTEISEEECGGLGLTLRVDPAFPLLPIFNYQTGSVNILVLGAFNANLARELIDVGGYYVRRDEHNLMRAWLMLPNVVTRNSMLELQVVMSGDTLEIYPGEVPETGLLEQHYSPDSWRWRVPRQGYEIMRRGFFVDYGQEILPRRLTLSARYLFFHETVYDVPNIGVVMDRRNRGLTPHGLEREPWDRSLLSLLSVNVVLGRVDLVQGYRFAGRDLRLIAIGSARALGSSRDYVQAYAAWRGFLQLGGRWDLGANAALAASTSDYPADFFTLGGDNLDPFVHRNKFLGLMNIRGFRATHLHGTRIGFANLEARFAPVFEVPLWLVGGFTPQLAAFIDAGHAWDGTIDADRVREAGAISAGGGVLLTFLDLPYTYVNWYVARRFNPDPRWTANILLMRPFF